MNEIPLKIKEQLCELSQKLPTENQQKQFRSGAVSRLKELSHQYENTLTYAAFGIVTGLILENLLTVPIPIPGIGGFSLADDAPETGGLLGGLLGFLKDRKLQAKEIEQAKQVAQIVQEELRKAATSKA